ncbi:MAG TPA: MBL fold metallo-hydrolase [Dehalococcoidia bacterium]|nr:MBL fold metallo-hydrolase [Dehalococcoidia bacterium]
MKDVVKDSNIRITRLELGPFGTNAYIVRCQTSGESILVDAPGDTDKILAQLADASPRYILVTHNHLDHIGALDELKSRLKIPVAIHPLDAARLPARPDIELHDGGVIKVGRLKLKVLHTPGHTPGSVCFLLGKYLISGDTVFPGGPGKTATPADLEQIVKSIETKIFVLPDETEVYPGHGDPTVLGKEKREFTVFTSRPHDPGLCGDVLWLSS